MSVPPRARHSAVRARGGRSRHRPSRAGTVGRRTTQRPPLCGSRRTATGARHGPGLTERRNNTNLSTRAGAKVQVTGSEDVTRISDDGRVGTRRTAILRAKSDHEEELAPTALVERSTVVACGESVGDGRGRRPVAPTGRPPGRANRRRQSRGSVTRRGTRRRGRSRTGPPAFSRGPRPGPFDTLCGMTEESPEGTDSVDAVPTELSRTDDRPGSVLAERT